MAYTTIKKPSDYFNTKLYTGTGSSQAVTGVGFQPDWLWIKNRSDAQENIVFDSVRGVEKRLLTDGTQAELTTTNHLSSFDSDGFTVPGLSNNTGASSNNYVSWNWLASNTTASNTVGDINSTVSVNTTSGFSIVSWTGTGANATVGHGLGVAPKFIIVKNRSSATFWGVQTPTGAGFEMNLNEEEGQTATSVYWNSTDPTSSVFSVGTNAATNNSGDNMIAYCFAPIKGFSKFGSYTGNGSTDGTFVYTGFKPAFVIVKRTNTTGSWMMFDNKRNTFNPEDKFLYSDLSNAEGTLTALDFVSNGFKFRNADTFWNASGSTYIYMAFAEEPLVGDNPATAR